MNACSYVGNELDLFAVAHRWKAYWLAQVRPYLRGHLLEVGAGLGTNTRLFDGVEGISRITCLEPDPDLRARIEKTLRDHHLSDRCTALGDDSSCLAPGQAFDSIVYIDVIEHIEDDVAEMRRAASLLRPGGHLVVLSPAHMWLYSEFDRSIGHCRRYSLAALSRLAPQGLQPRTLRYLDAVGLFASVANKLFLKRSMPTERQIRFWDSWMVPLSRGMDPLLRYHVGKSVLGVWQRT